MTETVTLSDRDRGVTVPSCREKKRLFGENTVSFCPSSMPSSVSHIASARGEAIEVPYRHNQDLRSTSPIFIASCAPDPGADVYSKYSGSSQIFFLRKETKSFFQKKIPLVLGVIVTLLVLQY